MPYLYRTSPLGMYMMEVGVIIVVDISNWTIGVIIQSDFYGHPGIFLSPVNDSKTFREGDLFPLHLTESHTTLDISFRSDARFAP